ncbi:succinylglutamate desuccinylase/aspartoacylase family protein [Francisellaceae bacterium]|nr:succinylglutamate desuccinylase/aspartoacylase family protein [Francisellaceae bacterium]
MLKSLANDVNTSLKVHVISDDGTKQTGWLDIPSPSNRSAWGVIRIPYTVIVNGKGPTAMISAGVHGDEYEGQVALNRLCHEINPEQIQGRVFILPALNIQGSSEATRLTPNRDQDLNRVFPGKLDGTPAERLAHFISHVLVPESDFVLDIHSGGYSLDFLPCGVIHDSTDKKTLDDRLKVLKAFDAPYSLILEELDGGGMLDTYVESQGKIFLSTELAGGQRVTAKTVNIALEGVKNTLRSMNILVDDNHALTQSTQVYTLPDNGFCMAPEDGVFEPFYDLGESVEQGKPVGQIHQIQYPQKKPIKIYAPCDGIVFGKRSPASTRLGDTLVLIATD